MMTAPPHTVGPAPEHLEPHPLAVETEPVAHDVKKVTSFSTWSPKKHHKKRDNGGSKGESEFTTEYSARSASLQDAGSAGTALQAGGSDLFGAGYLQAHRGLEPVYGQQWEEDVEPDTVRPGKPRLQASGTTMLLQHLKSNDAAVVLHPVEVKSNWILSRMPFQIFMMILTVCILFVGDIFTATLEVAADTAYNVILWVCLVFFTLEWGLNVVSSRAQTPHYNGSLFFWLDMIATLSIALDIIFIEANNLVNNGPIARAARAARLGTRAGRSMRLLRLLRFLRLVRVVRVVKAALKLTDKQHRKREPLDALDQALESDQTTRADSMGAQIGATTTRKVVIMTLILLIVLPLLERSEHGHTCGAELVMMMSSIYSSAAVGRDCAKMQVEVQPWLQTGLISFSQSSSSGLTKNGLLYVQVEGCVLYKNEALMGDVTLDQSTLANHRRGSEIQVIPCDATFADTDNDGIDSRSPTYFLYDMREEEKESAGLAIGFTVVVIVTLLGFSMVFSQDAEVLASELVIPIGQLSQDMRRTSNLEMDKVTPESEWFNSNVYEVRRLQLAYSALSAAMESFVKFMPLDVVKHFLDLGSEAVLGVQQRNVTIFFSDIVGFADICDHSAPKEVLDLLSEYFESMVTVIGEEQGCMLEFIGDAILAIWNAPNSVQEHSVRAVTSALRMNVELEKMRVMWEAENKPLLHIRVGLHAADVFVGNLGSRMRMKYGVLGDGVNLASRVTELNKRYNTEIVISEDAHNQAGVADGFYFRTLDYVVVKGRKNPTLIYEVLDFKDTESETIKSIAAQADLAWKSYMSRDFKKAIECLDAITQLKGLERDPVGEVLRERCRKFVDHPPGPEWDGSEVLLQKSFGPEQH